MDSNTVQERLATQINHDYELDQPIVADRGDPYALQVAFFLDLRRSVNNNFLAYCWTSSACWELCQARQ